MPQALLVPPGASAAATESAPPEAPELGPQDWERLCRDQGGVLVRVVYGRSLRVPVRLEGGPATAARVLRLHESFARAPAEVRSELLEWIRRPRRRRGQGALDAWLEARLSRADARPAPPAQLEPRGRVHDLETIQREVLAGHFAGQFVEPSAPAPRITWTRRRPSRSRHSLRLGYFDRARSLVHVHWVLDQEFVPREFVRFVVFHEHLHALLGEEPGACRHHGPRFRERERAYPDRERLLRWEREHIARLIKSAASGAPIRTARAGNPRGSGWIQRLLFA